LQAEFRLASAAIVGQKRKQFLHAFDSQRIDDRSAFAARVNQPCVGEFFQMKRERCRGDFEPLGDLAGRDANFPRRHEKPKDPQPRFLGEGRERIDRLFYFHISILLEMSKGDKMAGPNVLFLCTGNSCRSQMAEGWARTLKADQLTAYSAGIETHGLNPLAVKVMAEAGVDISGQKSQHIEEFKDIAFDLVVTVCARAAESCPIFPGDARMAHQPFDDPPRLARDAANEEEALIHYRRVRDEIREFIASLPENLKDYPHGV
jgi:arsenate reductase